MLDNHTCKMCSTLYDDSIVSPKEGELHGRTNLKYNRNSWKTIGEFNPPVWIANIDKCPTGRIAVPARPEAGSRAKPSPNRPSLAEPW